MIKRQITKKDLDRYNKKFKDYDLAKESVKKAMIRKDPTIFAYALFRNGDGSRLKLYPFQDMFLNDLNKLLLVVVSRQCGKSVGAVVKALHYIFFHDNSTVLLISKTLNQSKELIAKLKALINSSPMRNDFKSITGGVDNRSEFYLKNYDKDTSSRIISVPATDAARGYSADIVIADEIAFWENSQESFNEAILPTVSHTDGTIMMLSTPKGKIGIFYESFCKDIWSRYQFDWKVCPINTQDKMDLKLEQVGSFAFKQEYEASFVANQAAYFSESEVKRATHDYALGEYTTQAVVLGIDFGKKKDNTVIFIGLIEDPELPFDDQVLRVVEIIEKPLGTNYASIVKEVSDLRRKYNITRILYDATGVGEGPGDFMEDIDLPVEGIKFSIQSKANFYSNLKILFEKSKIIIPQNKRLRDELLLFEYEYTNSNNLKLHHPEGGHDDYADALALMAYGLKRDDYDEFSCEVL